MAVYQYELLYHRHEGAEWGNRQDWWRMAKAMVAFIGLVLFCSIVLGLWDLFRGASLLAGTVALMFVAAGTFNTWIAFKLQNKGARRG
jgi:hypothetical protein